MILQSCEATIVEYLGKLGSQKILAIGAMVGVGC